jgi:hypothetical protein
MSITRQLFIIGNAPLDKDYRDLIGADDIVVRFNDAVLDDLHTGSRVDILCITNLGEPARAFLASDWAERSAAYRAARTIVFPRAPTIHAAHYATVQQHYTAYPASEFDDGANAFIARGGTAGKEVVILSPELNRYAFDLLRNVAEGPFVCPSTGFLMLTYLLLEPRYQAYRKHLLGFGFEGWIGHPWAAERAIVAHYQTLGQLTLHVEARP